MSTRTVVVALVVAVALGLAAYILVKSGNKPGTPNTGVLAVGQQVMEVDPSVVKSIRLSIPGEPEQVVERDLPPGSGLWRLNIAGHEGTWPVIAERPINLLRVMGAVRAIAETEKEASIGDDPINVKLVFSDGAVQNVRLASRTLGGTGLIEVDPAAGSPPGIRSRKAMIDDSLHRSLRNPGPRGWRETSVVGGPAADASRIRLHSEDRAVTIARVGGKLGVSEPVSCEADLPAVSRLVRVLDGMQVTDFLDGGAPTDEATLGLAKPTAWIVLETDRKVEGAGPKGDMGVRTTAREVVIGNPADTKKETRYARLEKDGPVVVIGVTGLGRELFDAAAYVSPVASGAATADIGAIVLETLAGTDGSPGAGTARRLVRKMDKWAQAGSGGEETELSAIDARGVQDLLIFMTKKPAASVALERPASYMPLGRLMFLSPGNQPLETTELGTAGGSTFVLYQRTPGATERRGVYRVYPSNELPALLAPLAKEPKANGEPAQADAGRDIVK